MEEFKGEYITNKFSDRIYQRIEVLPIIDYHCHLSPQEIYEDKPFTSIGELWLATDHYKWRLMRTAGVDEKYITGDAPIKNKYLKFVEVISTAFGNPVRDWVQLELEAYFGIGYKICPKYANTIWDLANKKISEEKLSPRKLIERSRVEYIATTDDIASDLHYHDLLADYKVKITPSFRTDNLFLTGDIKAYKTYLNNLGKLENIKINSLDSLKEVINLRLQYFIKRGCKFSDIGVEGFPSDIYGDEKASAVFKKLLSEEDISDEDEDGLFGNLYAYLGKIYAENNIVQQWHLAVIRNGNTKALLASGRDSGYDSVGMEINIRNIQKMLDVLCLTNSLPETIIYPLNPAMNYPLTTLCGSFPGVHLGISWWFNDHSRGMSDTFNTVSELGHISAIVGMLTDSRSFLSYVRHDFYRQHLAEFIASKANESTDMEEAVKIAEKLSYTNAKELIGL